MADQTRPSSTQVVTVDGRYLRKGDERFIVKGLVYQSRNFKGSYPGDQLSDDRIDELQRDLILFKELQINTLFVYVIDIEQQHDKCMKLLADAGIYVIAVLSEGRFTISRTNPRETYTASLFNRFSNKIDSLAQHENVLGVCIANEIINEAASVETPSVIRTCIRDLKAYMKRRADIGQRVLPICINESDHTSHQSHSLDFFTNPAYPECAVDFYMFTNYAAISPDSKWSKIPSTYAHATVPIVISEYGNNQSSPRKFDEVDTLYSQQFLQILSGGCVYQYEMLVNGYGIVKHFEDGRIERLADFENYKQKLRAIGAAMR